MYKFNTKMGTEEYYFGQILATSDYVEIHPNGEYDFYGRFFDPSFVSKLEELSGLLAFVTLARGCIMVRFFKRLH